MSVYSSMRMRGVSIVRRAVPNIVLFLLDIIRIQEESHNNAQGHSMIEC